MKGFGDQNKFNKKAIKSDKKTKTSKEQIINQAIQFHLKGNISEATKYYKQLINQGCNHHIVFSNYGLILQNLGKLKDAEKLYHKSIELNPNFADAHSNLGNVLNDLGELEEAEKSYRKAIELNPNLAMAHYNLGNVSNDLGELEEAEKSYRKAIKLKANYANAYCNLGNVLRDLDKLQEAEISQRKAIEINPNFANAYSNLGNILSDLGELEEAEKSYRKAIELSPNLVKAYYLLSRIKYSDKNKTWQEKIFSEDILTNKSKTEKVDIYFARANILHKKKKYKESSKYLKLANNLKLEINSSKPNNLIDKFKTLLIESDKQKIPKKEDKNYFESIFIVGMPRSGSTLVESILSMRNNVCDLGELNFLDESFKEYKNSKQDINLAEIYKKKVNNKTKLKITTNKNLYNFQYTGIIANQIPKAKIIHCFRNPLDNILSIYRTHFEKGNEYSSSLVDCAKIYLKQEELMTIYKNKFKAKIYELNYDSLVLNPKQEIKSLITWLGWEWDDSYLSPQLNTRSVSTASSVQVRSPINSKSIDGWKNYKDMLIPAIKIITQIDKYKDLIL